jgi:hypothetical protein
MNKETFKTRVGLSANRFYVLMLMLISINLSACKIYSESQSDNLISADEYEIFSAEILQRLSQGYQPEMLVIRAEADSLFLGACLPESILDSTVNLSREELDYLVKDFKARNLIQGKLIKALNVPLKQGFISDSERRSVFSDTERYNGWKEFYKKFPGAIGYKSFTRAGFNADKTKALIHRCTTAQDSADAGAYRIFSKENGNWKPIGLVSCGVF